MITRETIYAALAAKLAAIPGVKTFSRRLRHWNDVSPVDMPAVFMVQKSEIAEQKRGFPTKWNMSVLVYVYVKTDGDHSSIPAQLINPIMDAIEGVLKPNCNGVADLGLPGVVSHAWIDGSIETDEGVLGEQAVAIVPIAILASSSY
jgi:hypothetical protein